MCLVCDFERENHKYEICVCDFCVYVCVCVCVRICVCVCDFGLENHKYEICVFVICVFDFGSGMMGRGGFGVKKKTCLLNGLGSGHGGRFMGRVQV